MCSAGKVKFQSLCLDVCPNGYMSNKGFCMEVPPETACSADCPNELLNNGICDEVCNIVACNSDNLACEHSGECPAG